MKILLISTLSHNPGDEIIRLGVENVLRQVFPEATLRVIHKHDPRTLFAGFKQLPKTPHRLISPYLYQICAATTGKNQENYLETADLVVFAGTPFIWRSLVRFFPFTSENAEWVGATWMRLFNEFPHKPVLNLAAGTSVTGKDQLDALLADPVVSGFLKRAVSRTSLTTSRDENTRNILGQLGFDVPVIPCASIMAAKGAHLEAGPPEYVSVNLMRSAAHSWRGQRGHSEHWRAMAHEVIGYLEKKHKIVFVSHSKDEDDVAAEWFPQHERVLSKDPIVLLKAYSKSIFGVCNRVHAAAAVASFGRPAIVIGGDSRINLVQQFGLPGFDHRAVDAATIISTIADVENNYQGYVDRLAARMNEAEQQYITAVRQLNLFGTGKSQGPQEALAEVASR